MKTPPSWEELLHALNDVGVQPDEKGWNVYRYLSANMGEGLLSEEARTLLFLYLKLPLGRPSLLHSMMLNVALKMTDTYADFKLASFLRVWNVAMLRREDFQQQAEGGKTFASLAERLAKKAIRYRMTHPADAFDPQATEFMVREAAKLGFLPVLPMVAVKIFESIRDNRKMRFVKLIGPKGEELSADWHVFKSKPWEIAGRMFEVLPRRSAETGNVRVDTVIPSQRDVERLFGKTIGYVDYFDEAHSHFHIFDPQSRHFVAESPEVHITVGEYVWFSPITPAQDKFKSAIILRKENAIDGRQTFGITTAKVTSISKEKGYFAYATDDERRGYADLKLSPRPLAVGDEVRLIAYNKRFGKDDEKRLYVAEML